MAVIVCPAKKKTRTKGRNESLPRYLWQIQQNNVIKYLYHHPRNHTSAYIHRLRMTLQRRTIFILPYLRIIFFDAHLNISNHIMMESMTRTPLSVTMAVLAVSNQIITTNIMQGVQTFTTNIMQTFITTNIMQTFITTNIMQTLLVLGATAIP